MLGAMAAVLVGGTLTLLVPAWNQTARAQPVQDPRAATTAKAVAVPAARRSQWQSQSCWHTAVVPAPPGAEHGRPHGPDTGRGGQIAMLFDQCAWLTWELRAWQGELVWRRVPMDTER